MLVPIGRYGGPNWSARLRKNQDYIKGNRARFINQTPGTSIINKQGLSQAGTHRSSHRSLARGPNAISPAIPKTQKLANTQFQNIPKTAILDLKAFQMPYQNRLQENPTLVQKSLAVSIAIRKASRL